MDTCYLGMVCLFGLVFFAMSAGGASAGDILDDIVAAQLDYMNRIQSIDFSYGELSVLGDVTASEFGKELTRYEHVNRVRWQGGMWRGDAGIREDGRLPEDIESYDGIAYQWLEGEFEALAVRQNETYFTPFVRVPPMLRLFNFAYNDAEEDGYAVLREAETWSRWRDYVAPKVVEQSRDIDGRSCTVVEFTHPPELSGMFETRTRIYFDETGNYFPVLVERVVVDGAEERLRSVTKVNEVRAVETELGTVVIPVNMELASWTDTGVAMSEKTWIVEQETLRVNEEIDLAEFTIPPMLAKSYVDADIPDLSYSTRLPDSDEELVSKDDDSTDFSVAREEASQSAEDDLPSAGRAAEPTPVQASGGWRAYSVVGLVGLLVVSVVGIRLKRGKSGNR